MAKKWFVTGASRGIGRELVTHLLARGDTVAATLRRPEQIDDLANRFGDRLWRRALDVTRPDEVRRVVDAAFAELGRIDVIVSNAGYGLSGAVENFSDADVHELIATNLTGSIQLARAALPHLRAQGGGLLMQMSSMGGQITFPSYAVYHATKWGIEGFFDSLAYEVEPLGVHTILVEPGVVHTGFFAAAAAIPVSEPYRGGPADLAPPTAEEMANSPQQVAAAMVRAADADRPPRRLVLGTDAWELITQGLASRLIEVSAQRDNASI